MISFESDYIAGAHPKVLKHLFETNEEALTGYGLDKYSESAKEKIKQACSCPHAQVEFLVGGTQTNSVIISTMLKDYEGVVAAASGHVSTHEAGAIEYTGHEVLLIPQTDGKINSGVLEKYLNDFFADENCDHMVFPGMVYISHPTEYGTLYSKQELSDIHNVCRAYNIPLYLDGARLGFGLMSKSSDMTLADIAMHTDVFYIGGTKIGALCGEAVVFTKNNRPAHFVTSIKKRGALLAKGRLLGVQFDALFTDGLYFDISRHAIDLAEKLKDLFKEKGYRFYLDSPTNQQFIIMENSRMRKLKEHVEFSFWEKYDDEHTVLRFATGWSTTEDDIEKLAKLL